MKPGRVAALTSITGLALADVAGAVCLSASWQEQHPPGGPAPVDARQGAVDVSAGPEHRRMAVERSL